MTPVAASQAASGQIPELVLLKVSELLQAFELLKAPELLQPSQAATEGLMQLGLHETAVETLFAAVLEPFSELVPAAIAQQSLAGLVQNSQQGLALQWSNRCALVLLLAALQDPESWQVWKPNWGRAGWVSEAPL